MRDTDFVWGSGQASESQNFYNYFFVPVASVVTPERHSLLRDRRSPTLMMLPVWTSLKWGHRSTDMFLGSFVKQHWMPQRWSWWMTAVLCILS